MCLSLSSQLRSSFMSVVFDFNASLNDVAPVSPMWLPVYVMWNEEEWIVDGCLCVPSFVDTVQIEPSECCVWFQWFTQWCCSCVSNIVSYWSEVKWKERIVDECLLCVFFLLSLPLRISWVIVVFDFSASLNDVAPVSPISLADDVKRKEEEWFVDGCLLCVLFLFSSPLRSSWVSVVFDFSASLSDAAPVSPISFPNISRNMVTIGFKVGTTVSHEYLLLTYHSSLVQKVLCLFVILCSMLLSLLPQFHSLCVVNKTWKEWFLEKRPSCTQSSSRFSSVSFLSNASANALSPDSSMLFTDAHCEFKTYKTNRLCALFLFF